MTRTTVFVNGSFRGQRVTGQQRYAGEVTRRLVLGEQVQLLEPSERWGESPLLAHLWAQTRLPVQAAGGALLSMTARSPIVARRHVLVVHDLFPLTHPEWYSRKYAATHGAQLAAQMRTATTLAAVSQPVAEQLRERHPGKRIIVAPNAPAECFAATEETQDPEGLPDGFLLAVGSMDPRKNFARLAHAYSSLPSVWKQRHPLCIVGGTGVNFATMGVDLTAEPTARLLGYVDDNRLAALYSKAAAVVVPSLDEGFGLPLVEAMATGAPVVASDIPVFRWVARERAHYFDPLSEESIAAALVYATDNPPSADQRDGNRLEILTRFNWATTAETLLDAARATV